MSDPFFSVLLPAYNAREHIGRALRDLMAQTFADFEVLVVDDGSRDGTGDVVKTFSDPRIRLFTLHKNRGLVGALNAGLSEARGIWIARQDADDRCRKNRLARQNAAITENPDVGLFYSQATLIDGRGLWRGKLRPPTTTEALRWDLCFRNSVPHTSAVFNRSTVWDELGGYAGDNVTADYDLWSRLLRKGSAFGDPCPLVSYRNHRASIMGTEMASAARVSDAGLKAIMVANLREWASAGEDDAGSIASAWLDPYNADWTAYFHMTDQLSRRMRPDPALLAEEDYTLMHRAQAVSRDCAREMLAAMKNNSPCRFRNLPIFRTTISRMAARLK